MSLLKKIFGKSKPAAKIGTTPAVSGVNLESSVASSAAKAAKAGTAYELSAGKAAEKPVKKTAALVEPKSKEAIHSSGPTKKVEARPDPDILNWLSKPLISEKATDLTQFNQYCFIVPKTANKSEVAKKIANLYGVKPLAVNFIRAAGKKVRHGRRFGWKKDSKKAIVILAPGDKIELYEGV
ncbi:50S ribosomal protein L23 [Candidatus Falkowbacteria bacterium]|nr:50S ribosomal protein L23 [Candidatus Falkowbacteria bacterium]